MRNYGVLFGKRPHKNGYAYGVNVSKSAKEKHFTRKAIKRPGTKKVPKAKTNIHTYIYIFTPVDLGRNEAFSVCTFLPVFQYGRRAFGWQNVYGNNILHANKASKTKSKIKKTFRHSRSRTNIIPSN